MSTEDIKAAVDAVKNPPQEDTQVENKTPELTDVEKRAIEMGWKPRSEFDGEDDAFIDAKEFVRRAPLFEKIEHQSKQLKSLERSIDALRQHYTAREEAAVQNAIKQLKEQRKEALSQGDGDAFEVLDEQIKIAEKEVDKINKLEQKQIEPEIHPEFTQWTKRNSWYTETGYMRKWADDYGTQLHQQGKSPLEVLKEVEKAVRKEFPQKFTNPNKANAPDVETSGRGSGGSRSESFELTDNERRIMNTLVSTKQMTKEEYITQLKGMYPERVKK